jgi:prepilin-type N-terminal cleavage/methylation domain-containing protein
MRRGSFRGVTLLEVMTVVAIVGILSALGGGALMNLVKTNRVVSSAKEVMAMARAARTRALASSCPHFIQLNGRSYAGAAPTPNRPSTIFLVRKGVCSSTLPYFEATDKVVDSAVLGSESAPGSVAISLPAAVLPTLELIAQSVTVAYDGGGNVSVALDGGGGFTVVATVTSLLVTSSAAGGPQPPPRVAITTSGAKIEWL